MKVDKRVAYAIAAVVGSATGVAVYLWQKHNKEELSCVETDIEVSPSIPDDLVPEARRVGCFLWEELEDEHLAAHEISVEGVVEFEFVRVYTLIGGENTYHVMTDESGDMEIEQMHVSPALCADCTCV